MDEWKERIRVFDRNLSRRMARIREKESNAGSECCHGLMQGTCSLCLGYPQSHMPSGSPIWLKERL